MGPIFGTSEFVDAKRKIEKMIEVYSASLNSLAVTIGGELLRHDKTEKRQKVLEWLWSGDTWLKHHDLQKRRVLNTGTWILRNAEFREWFSGDGPRFLLCQGIRTLFLSTRANLQKPALESPSLRPLLFKYMTNVHRSLVIDNANSHASKSFKTAVIQFYFDYNDEESQDADDVVASFVKQLVYQLDFVPTKLEAAYDRWIAKAMRPNRDFFIDLFLSCADEFSKVYVFLDAYDECVKSERRHLIQFVQQFSQPGLNICTFITTRPHPLDDLKSQLKENKTLEIKATLEDVEKYINEKLESETLKQVTKSKIVNSIRRAAKGMSSCSISMLISQVSVSGFSAYLRVERVGTRRN